VESTPNLLRITKGRGVRKEEGDKEKIGQKGSLKEESGHREFLS